MNPGRQVLKVLCAASVGLSPAQWATAEPEIAGFAFVQPDSTLRVSGSLIRDGKNRAREAHWRLGLAGRRPRAMNNRPDAPH